MIYIDKDAVNNIALSLTESSTLTNPFYLFAFQREFDLDESPILFTTPDISQFKERYNLFILDEGTDLTLIKGQYSYSVYESLLLPVTIDDTTGIIIEEGRMVVSSDTIEFTTIYD